MPHSELDQGIRNLRAQRRAMSVLPFRKMR